MKHLLLLTSSLLGIIGHKDLLNDYPVTICTPEEKPNHMGLSSKFDKHIEFIERPQLELKDLGFPESYSTHIKKKKKAHENQSTSKFIPNTRKQH